MHLLPGQTVRECAVDIETCNPSEEIMSGMRETAAATYPGPPANYKDPEKIERHRIEYLDKATEKAALSDQAPISCVALAYPTGVYVWHWGPEATPIEGATVIGGSDERDILERFGVHLDAITTPLSEIVVHNGLGFDLPRLRLRMQHHGVKPPECMRLGAKNPIFDTMRNWKYFSVSSSARSGFVSLDEIVRSLGIPSPKDGGISGADVPAYIEQGRWQEVATYCCADALATLEVFRHLKPWLSEDV